MARPIRSDEPGAIHHVFGRGNHKREIFLRDEDQRFFLKTLLGLKDGGGLFVHGHALMMNHYHLVLETGRLPLSVAMRKLLSAYARYLNDRTNSIGHVFQGRFKETRCIGTRHYLTALAYVHLNPVEAGLCADPGDWPWSGHRALCGAPDGIVDVTAALLRMPEGIDSYHAAIARGLDRIRDSRLTARPQLQQLLEEVRTRHGLAAGVLEGPSRLRQLTAPRVELIRAAMAAGIARTDIARSLKRTPSAINQLLRSNN